MSSQTEGEVLFPKGRFNVVPSKEQNSRGKRFFRRLGEMAGKAKESFSNAAHFVGSKIALAPGNVKESLGDKSQENGHKKWPRLMAVGAIALAGVAFWAHQRGYINSPGSSGYSADPSLAGHIPTHTDVMAQPTGGSAQSSMPGVEHVPLSSSPSASVDSVTPAPSASPDIDTSGGSGGGIPAPEVQPPAPAPEVLNIGEGQGQIKATQVFLQAKGYSVTSEQAEIIAGRVGPIASGPGVGIDPSSGLQIFNGGPGDYSMSAGSSDEMIKFAKELLAQQ